MVLFRNVSLSRGKSTTRFGGNRFFQGKVTIFIGRETKTHILPTKINEKKFAAVRASEPQSRSVERPRHSESEPVIIPSSYWHCSAPGNSSLQVNTSRLCYYQSACWRPLCPFEHTTRGEPGSSQSFGRYWRNRRTRNR